MDSFPFVSVVVATRNRAKLLHDCVEGLLQQDSPADRYEVIVCDDGSTDETAGVVFDLKALTKRSGLRYLRPERRGPNVARNAGFRAARGDLFALVDDDAIAPPSWLKAVVEGCLRHPDAECFGGPARVRLEGKAPRFCDRDGLDVVQDLGDTERRVDDIHSCNMVIRRTGIEKAGLFNEVLSGAGDETEWVLRLTRAGGRIVYLPNAWVWHRRTARDLALSSLLRSKFRRGREEVLFARVVGRHLNLGRELGAIPRFLAHALRRRCIGGLLSASMRLGRAWGLIRNRSPIGEGGPGR